MNLRQVEAFRAVMITGSITRAGDILCITQPAVSRLIADLEHSLGFKLFERQHRRVVPTPEAELLYIEVKRAFSRLDDIEHVARAIKHRQVGQLSIIAAPSLSIGIMSELLRAFHERYPDVAISLEVALRTEIIDKIAMHHFDIGVIGGRVDSSAIECLTVATSTAVCVVPHGHRLAERSVISPQDLANECFISVQRDALLRSQVDAAFQRHGVPRPDLMEVRTHDAAIALVAGGLGVTIIVQHGVPSDYYRYVRMVRFEPRIEHEMTLIFPAQKVRSRATVAFVEMFRERRAAERTARAPARARRLAKVAP